MTTSVSQKRKSGVKTFKPGEVLFNENETASSLYIIQKGQVRLYRPKGRGYVELAILRSGEVIGEMAYFDDKASRRSCSAAAIVPTEVIEISFKAFGKTLSGLNPWFKTIIHTLADRLRKTNEKVKALEANSVGFGKGGKVGDYVFFHNVDIIKMLSLYYLVFKTHGEQTDKGWELHQDKLKFYMQDVFNVQEVKFAEFNQMMKDEGFLKIEEDEDGMPKQLIVKNIDGFRTMMVFFNTQRMTEDQKKLQISENCQKILQAVLNQLTGKAGENEPIQADLTSIFEVFRNNKMKVSEDDFKDAVKAGFAEDIVVGGQNNLTAGIYYSKLKKMFPCIRLMNAVKRINAVKAKDQS